MKIIIYIISFYIILLSAMPCVDAEPNLSLKKLTINNQSQHHHDNDACSPLCICNCCGCQGFDYHPVYNYNFIAVKTIIDKKLPEYQSIPSSNFFVSIWQPPQIIA